MDHPHHDDSHLPEAVENTEENRERLITHILDKKNLTKLGKSLGVL